MFYNINHTTLVKLNQKLIDIIMKCQFLPIIIVDKKIHILCVCVTGHRSVEYVRIMRWLNSNLGQWPLQNLGSVAYSYVFIIDLPRPLLPRSDVLLGKGRSLLTWHLLHQHPSFHRTGSSSHPSVTYLRPIILIITSLT